MSQCDTCANMGNCPLYPHMPPEQGIECVEWVHYQDPVEGMCEPGNKLINVQAELFQD